MFGGGNIVYRMAKRTKAVVCGGIGAIMRLARGVGLISVIDEKLELLKVHLPYHESDHVMNIVLNLLAGGRCLEDLEHLRNDENYLNALGAQRIPDPTTAGDFCRRFEPSDVEELQDAINGTRLRIWAEQPWEFFQEAILDIDGSQLETTGECKEGMEISRDGVWGYHPLLISLANTQEPLFLRNRSGNRPSHEGAPELIDRAVRLCRAAGFREITLRGDTDFALTKHLDRWDEDDVRFVFGYDAMPNLVEIAENLDEKAWERLERRSKYVVKTKRRERPSNVKEEIVRERRFKNIRLQGENVAEFTYRPRACETPYRVVVVRKNLSIEKGEDRLFDEVRYFFYITNDWIGPSSFIVFDANDRCNQENLIGELKNGVRALHAPVNSLVSNWAYMVMASLAWSLKAWFALLLPESGRWAAKHKAEKEAILRMDFRTFVQYFMMIPTQISRQGRQIVYTILGWNRCLRIFFRGWNRVRHIQLC
jgi:hypothetical protein